MLKRLQVARLLHSSKEPGPHVRPSSPRAALEARAPRAGRAAPGWSSPSEPLPPHAQRLRPSRPVTPEAGGAEKGGEGTQAAERERERRGPGGEGRRRDPRPPGHRPLRRASWRFCCRPGGILCAGPRVAARCLPPLRTRRIVGEPSTGSRAAFLGRAASSEAASRHGESAWQLPLGAGLLSGLASPGGKVHLFPAGGARAVSGDPSKRGAEGGLASLPAASGRRRHLC